MGAPGFNFHFEERELAVRRINFPRHHVMSYSIAASEAARSHARPFLRVPADCALNRPALPFRPPMHQRNISLVDLAPAELLGELSMRRIVLSNNHQPAGRAIQTMNDSRS